MGIDQTAVQMVGGVIVFASFLVTGAICEMIDDGDITNLRALFIPAAMFIIGILLTVIIW